MNKQHDGIQYRHREETRAQIQQAAEHVFADYGYVGASFSRIAAEAGLPKSNVVYYYQTKEKLYRNVVENIFDVWRKAADVLSPERDPIAALGDYIETKLELARTRLFGSKVWANEIIQRTPVVQYYLEGEPRQWTHDRIAVIEYWIAQKQIRPVSARHLLYAIWAITQHYADLKHQIRTLNNDMELTNQQWQDMKYSLRDILLEGVKL